MWLIFADLTCELLGVALNSFIIELLELIKILQPISRKELIEIYKTVKGFTAFKFVKSDDNDFHNEIKYDYIIKLLETVGLITLEADVISTDKYDNTQSLMFDYPKKSESKERNRLLCRKYRYGGNIK